MQTAIQEEGPTLVDVLGQIPDFRRKQGRRFQLPNLLLMIILAIMSGHYGYREIARFLKANQQDLVRALKLKRPQMPSHVTIRTVLMGLDFEQLNNAFRRWADQELKLEPGQWLALDAKAIASTVSEPGNRYQDFVALVSAFSHERGLVLTSKSYHNKHTSEIDLARELIAALVETLGLKGVTMTLDAVHCKKRPSSKSSPPATTT